MTPQEALSLLDRVVGNVAGTRADHINIQAAVNVLQAAITPPPPPEPATSAEPPPSNIIPIRR